MQVANLGKKNRITQKLGKKIAGILFFIICFELVLFPLPTIAEETGAVANDWGNAYDLANISDTEPIFVNSFPQSDDLPVKWSRKYPITAYNSLEAQTNSQPCITANGFDLCQHWTEDTIAANFLKFGTRVRIPELFGDRVFIVRDRMNSRYTHRLDVWMKHHDNAKEFGLRHAKIEVLADSP